MTIAGAEQHAVLMERLNNAFSRRVVEMEARYSDDGASLLEDVKNIGLLAKTMETLVSLSQKMTSAGDAPDDASIRDELHKLMDRLCDQSGCGRSASVG